MNLGTVLVLLVLLVLVTLIVRSMVRAKKSGRSLQCGCDCARCGGGCHQAAHADKPVR